MTDGPIRLNKVTRAAVDSGRLVHLATINPDGTPAGFVTRISPRKISGTGPWGLAD
jgi:hypothetical protein